MISSIRELNSEADYPVHSEIPPQLEGRDVVVAPNSVPVVLLRAIDQANSSRNALQQQLGRRIQEGEVALFDAAHANLNLNRRLNVAERQVEEQRNRADGLEEQLIAVRNERDAIGAQLNEARAQAENGAYLRADLQRSFEAVQARIVSLEQQITIANERAAQLSNQRVGLDVLVTRMIASTTIAYVSPTTDRTFDAVRCFDEVRTEVFRLVDDLVAAIRRL